MIKIAVIHHMLGYADGKKLIRTLIREDYKTGYESYRFTDKDIEDTLNALAKMDEEEYGDCDWEEDLPWYVEEDNE